MSREVKKLTQAVGSVVDAEFNVQRDFRDLEATLDHVDPLPGPVWEALAAIRGHLGYLGSEVRAAERWARRVRGEVVEPENPDE